MNRLADESSAYLRQHADNPVHWFAFGADAFAAAVERDVPVFLSIGYAACHWCHVMAHESFEDAGTAAYLNDHFVSVKVDREERPDVDSIYMSATQAMTGQGGWPMSVFLLPDGRAFFAGTYFPPQPLPGRASFVQVLQAVTEAWVERRGEVEASAGRLADQLAHGLQVNRDLIGPISLVPDGVGAGSGGAGADGAHAAGTASDGADEAGGDSDRSAEGAAAEEAVRALSGQEDPEYGGFGGAPKFPPSPVLGFLLRHAAGGAPTAGTAAEMAGRTLQSMASSALFDQLEGGFARYAVDRQWMIPHFEKMLYDNAQLVRLYAHWSRLAGPHQDAARRTAAETAEWMIAELELPSGAFASSLDADSVIDGVHQEGGTYLWTREQLRSALGEDGTAVAELMGVGEQGTVTEAGSALHPGRALTAAETELWNRARPRLRAVRRQRPQPGRDEKVVAGWNGLAAAGLAETGAILGRPDLIEAAERAGSYLAAVHVSGGGALGRVSHEGRARGIGGLLEDYAFCADGFFALYAATGKVKWYQLAAGLVDGAVERFVVNGHLQDSGTESSQLRNAHGGAAPVDPVDNVTASGAAALGQVLITYAAYSGSARTRTLAESILSYAGRLAPRAPRAVGAALAALEAASAGPVQVAITGTESAECADMIRAAWDSPSPGLVLALGDEHPGTDAQAVPLLQDRPPGPRGAARAYVCRAMICELPAETAGGLRAQLGL